MSDSLYDGIITFLKENAVEYKEVEHEPVFTSQDAATIRDTSPHQGAKALVLFGDKKPLMVVLAGDYKLDIKVFKKTYAIEDLRMATKEEVLEVTHVPVGAVPPFGNLVGIAVYMDDSLRDNEEIAFNSGLHTKSIIMKEADYERIVKPTVGKFCQIP